MLLNIKPLIHQCCTYYNKNKSFCKNFELKLF